MSIHWPPVPRCEEARAFTTRMATGEGRGSLGYIVPLTVEGVEYPSYGYADWQDSPQKFLESRLAHLARRHWGHDHAVPVIAPNCFGGGFLATAFGARYDPVMNWTHPAVTDHDDIELLPLDVTLDDGLIPKALEFIEYVVRHTGGQIPLQMYNSGGPMDILSMAMDDQQLMLALNTHPAAVHRLLDVCTDLYIAFYKAQRALVRQFVPTLVDDMWWPDGQGILCGEDWLSVISPKMALEFEVPYINRISDAFGGVMIHACGSLEINYLTLKNHVRNLKGLYFNAGETSFPKAVQMFRGTDVVLMPRWAVNRPYRYESRLDFVKKILAAKTPDISVFLWASQAADPMITEDDPNAVSQQILEVLDKGS